MNQKRKTLPAITGKAPSELRPLLEAIKEILETGEGVRGDKLDQKLTYRDLLDVGVLKLRIPGSGLVGGVIPGFPGQDMTIPPRPTGFSATGGFYGIITLAWDVPQRAYNNHGYTNIYRSEDDNFANAEVIGIDAGFMYSDKVRNDAEPDQIVGFYYWVTYVSSSNVEGPPNSPNGTYAEPLPDLGLLIEQLSGQLSESELSQALRQKIDTSDLLSKENEAAIRREVEERLSGESALAQEITTLSAALQSGLNGEAQRRAAAIQQENTARVNADQVLANSISTVSTTANGNTAAIQQQSQTVNGLSAQFTLRLDVNGYVSGFGAYNSGAVADFAVLADRFWIARPGAANSRRKPFIVQGGNVYIDTAFIREASIQEGQLGPIGFGKIFDSAGNPVTNVAGKLRVENIDVENLQVGNQQISGVIQSNQTGAGGRPRWRLDKSGGLELNGVANGGRMEVRDNVIKVFDGNGTLRVQLGDLTA